MSGNIALLDSNILVYAFDSSEKEKNRKAKKLLQGCFLGTAIYAVSIQNLSEFFYTITKKIEFPVSGDIAASLVKKMIEFSGFKVLEPNKFTILRATELYRDKNIPYWDALIIATMMENQIFGILTENTKDFQRAEGITARNPFL